MSDLIWPAVVVAVAILAFIRTRPSTHFTAKLEVEKPKGAESASAQVVIRLNDLTKDMNAVKTRLLSTEEKLEETSRAVSTMRAASGLKKVMGVEK